MADYKHTLYQGGNYMQSGMSEYGPTIAPYVPPTAMALTTNAQMANQLKATSDSINTGAKTVEVQLTFANIEKAIPNQHLDEINRLRKLTGVDLTVHGPMLEPTGVTDRGEWDPMMRQQTEDQMWNALKRAAKVDERGNVVVTFHSSFTLPEPETKQKINGKEVTTGIGVVQFNPDRNTASVGNIPVPGYDNLLNKKQAPEDFLKEINQRSWNENITNINQVLLKARELIDHATSSKGESESGTRKDALSEIEKYKKFTPEEKEAFSNLKSEGLGLPYGQIIDDKLEYLSRGGDYLNDAVSAFKQAFNTAWATANNSEKKGDVQKLESFREEWINTIEKARDKEGHLELSKLDDVKKTLSHGLNILRDITPERIVPIKKFALTQASETFSNLALKGYGQFGDKAPIISLENHPASPMSGFNRADQMKELIDNTRKVLSKKLVEKEGLSESQAKKEAEKLIGVTWDVGHINLIKKYGYDDDDLKKEFKTIAPYVKHLHLSDNFGFEHAELPMGMGNVPMADYEKILKKQYGDKVKDIKRVIETGDWYQHFQSSPLPATLASYGSPIYSMEMAPAWNQAQAVSAGYMGGYGNFLPDVHFSQIYGGGFSSLPVELGGSVSGRSRFSGNPNA